MIRVRNSTTEQPSETRRRTFEAEALVHLDALLKTAVRITPRPLDAEDVVQETYLRAWKHFDSFEAGTNCRAWLFRILFNVIKARGGSQARRRETPLEEEGESDLPPSNVVFFDPNRRIEGREVLEMASRLPDEQRAVLCLVVVEEFSYREAAEILDVPVGTVMSRLHRARRELRKMLASSPLNRRAQ